MYSARVLSSSSVHNDVTFASESAVPAGLQLRLSFVTTTEKNYIVEMPDTPMSLPRCRRRRVLGKWLEHK